MYTKIGIIIFSLAIILGPLYTVENYSVTSNTISELGAQGTKNNFVAIIGFVAFGLGIILDSIRHRSRSCFLILLFGVFIITAGFLPHKPINPEISYNATINTLHSIMATLSGIALTTSFLLHSVRTISQRERISSLYLASVCIVFPMLMFSFPAYQGIIQRLMYAQIFIWLWFSNSKK